MDIKAASLLNEMQMMAQKVDANQPLEGMGSMNKVSQVQNTDFSSLLKEAVDNVQGLQSQAGKLINSYELGDRSVALSDVMIASNKSGLAFDATLQVRNKLVESYKQIMSMPI